MTIWPGAAAPMSFVSAPTRASFLLNDYDFGEGGVPTVTYATLPQFIYGVASTATKTFPLTTNEPFNFLNLDLYAQDTWKITPKLTWTIGIRDTLNSNPLNPHAEVARLQSSFTSISHDLNQPFNQAIQTHLGHLFDSTPLAILQPRTALAWQFAPGSVLRAGFGIFSDILPGSIADVIGINPPYVQSFQGGLLGTVGGSAIAPGVPGSAVDATVAANRSFTEGFAQGWLSCASPRASISACLPPVALTAVPSGELHPPYFMEWSFGIEHQFGNAAALHAQYVGTRAVNQPYLTQVNGYQTVCQGCFAPFPYLQPADPRFGRVTQFSTGANSHYHGLQLTAMKRVSHGLQGQINYTFSRCMDELSNGGFLQFSAAAVFRHFLENFGGITDPATTTFGTTSTSNMSISFRSKPKIPPRRTWSTTGRFPALSSGTAAFHFQSSAHLIPPLETASYKAADRSLPVSCRACRFTITTSFPASPNPAQSSG